MSEVLVGTVKGPGERPSEFVFITPDNNHTRVGEFVYYLAQSKHGNRLILGNITERRLARSLPDSFLADPSTPPASIATMIGLMDEKAELYEIDTAVIGFFDEGLADFVNPRIPPTPGQPVYLASSDMLARVLSPRELGQPGGAYIGSLLTREPEGSPQEVPVVLSVKDIVSTHLAVLASTGAGKSYTAAVLIEELMKPANRSAVLVVDPHGEYETLQEIKETRFKRIFGAPGYEPEVKILRPEKVKVRFDTMEYGDIVYLLHEPTEKMKHFLGEAFNDVRKHAGPYGHYVFQDLMDAIAQQRYGDENSDRSGNVSTIDALEWRLNSRFRGHGKRTIFHDSEHNLLTDLFRPGQCTVLELVDIDQDEQQVIVGTLLRRAILARMATLKDEVTDPMNERYLPYPIFALLEEAHRFAPAGQTVVSTNVLKQILSEGRKFGVGVGLITQRPGKLDSDVLSQCMTQFIMRIVNPIDQDTIAKTVEGAGRRMLDELPALTKGQLIVSGVAVNTPLMCQVRNRLTKHGGETIDAPAEWTKWHSGASKARREEQKATLAKPEPPSRGRIGGIEI
ncbi:MAG TPA: ATP-binding protein [Blastocatellia bacterium]|nr:ATP-binding protein [Blastocatellia bacterium]